ncbi:MAG: lytic transglycosylase domain-containing protein [Sphingobacteriales bacterium]|nr:MAG: lytic transglycosylase domain-containing protein [Sphingobacteriales bacterium]
MHAHIKKLVLHLAASAIALTSLSIVAWKAVNKDEELVEVKQDGRLQYKWSAPSLPTSMSFAGEKVPLGRTDVREQLDRELLYNYYNQYSTIYILKLAGRYFPVIEPILKANGIPDDFKFLCVAESALQNQTSRVGAVGFWQFMPATAPQYGLEISDDVDERYDVVKSTEAACKYFRQAYNKFGSWTAAAASYNMGQGGYNGQSNFQRKDNYYDLMLPEETMRYVFRILAFKLLTGHPEKYGYAVNAADTYKPVKTRSVTVDTSIPDLAAFALGQGSTYRKIKQQNPWLRERRLTVRKGKSYVIAIPVE